MTQPQHLTGFGNWAPPAGATAALFFLPGQFVFRTFEQGREVVTKALLAEQVARAFHEYSADSGWLPTGRRALLRTLMGAPRGDLVASCEAAGVKRVLCIDATGEIVELRIPLPTLVLFGKGRGEFHLAATKDPNPGPDSKLYAAPCPNVGSGDGGRICFGRNEPPEASPGEIEAVWELFWGSPFSMDHSAQKSRSEPEDVRNLWKTLHDRKARRFPMSELVPFEAHGRPVTVADFWHRLARSD